MESYGKLWKVLEAGTGRRHGSLTQTREGEEEGEAGRPCNGKATWRLTPETIYRDFIV